MHPIEYTATLIVGAGLLIASYVFGVWALWIIGLILIVLPVLGVPQMLERLAAPQEPKKSQWAD